MGYDNMHRITSKSQHLTQDNVQFNGTLNVGYDLSYTYGSENEKKSQLTSVKDINYRTRETPGGNNIENNHVHSTPQEQNKKTRPENEPRIPHGITLYTCAITTNSLH